MSVETKQLVELVTGCLREVADQEGLELPQLDAQTELFGTQGFLDSSALVMLVTLVEEAIDERYSVTVSLADERAMSRARSPFQTIASLAEYAREEIVAARGDG
jgi:hypothetical protein